MASRLYEGSKHAALYARYRPTIPGSLVNLLRAYVSQQVSDRLRQAVDVGCGSGQGTRLLALHFDRVLGTDISPAQISEAVTANQLTNVTYRASAAETTGLPAASAQLILAVQACHWFDMPALYTEAERVLSRGGALALAGYRLPVPVYRGREVSEVHRLIVKVTGLQSYVQDLAGYMQSPSVDAYIDGYSHTRFQSPFADHKRDETTYCDLHGTVRDLVGYCSTWSGFQKFVAEKGQDEGEKFLQRMEDRIIQLLGDDAAEDSSIVLRFRYFALLSRKAV